MSSNTQPASQNSRASLEPYTVDYAANITGLSPELIRKTALLYGNAKAAFIGWTMGVNHSTKGTETVNAINNLALITGQYRPRRRLALFHHRTMQRHGHARSRLHLLASRLSQV